MALSLEDIEKLRNQLESWGESKVREQLTARRFGEEGAAERAFVEDWLREKTSSRTSEREDAALEEAKRSNRLAESANSLAQDANRLAHVANSRAFWANIIALTALAIAIITALMSK